MEFKKRGVAFLIIFLFTITAFGCDTKPSSPSTRDQSISPADSRAALVESRSTRSDGRTVTPDSRTAPPDNRVVTPDSAVGVPGSGTAAQVARKLGRSVNFLIGLGNDLANDHNQDAIYKLKAKLDLHYAYLVNTSTTSPNFRDYLTWSKAISSGVGRPILWWQIPLGVASSTRGGTPGRYRDNRVKYLFAHVNEFIAAGGIGAVFGVGAGNQTTVETDGGQFDRATSAYYISPSALP